MTCVAREIKRALNEAYVEKGNYYNPMNLQTI